jgi:hypothetical protein
LGDWIKVKDRKHPAAMERVMEIPKPRQAKGRPRGGALSWSTTGANVYLATVNRRS